jgi:uncharacterized RDD family membrane protein YckC
MEHNPYQSPRAVVADYTSRADLASRGARLGASLLDGIIMMAIIVPVMIFGGYFTAISDAMASGQSVSLLVQLMWGVLFVAIGLAIQVVPLKRSGQTWGKKVVGLKIVDMDGAQPGLGVLLGRRYLFAHGVGLIPFLGGLISTVNILFIFRGDKRCLHDLVAGTQVINAGQ